MQDSLLLFPPFRTFVLPWSPSPEEQRRFRRILAAALGLALLLSVVVPWLPVSQVVREQAPPVPPRFARLLLERKPVQPPPPPLPAKEAVKPQPKAEKAPEAKPVKKVAKAQPKPTPKAKVAPAPTAAKRRAVARERARHSGVLLFQDDLADLREGVSVASLARPATLTGSGGGSARKTERAILTAGVARGSGGINTAALSRDVGGPAALKGRTTTRVASTIGDGSEGGTAHVGGDGHAASRSMEEIQMVFDRNKGAIYALYNRELRKNPTLAGKVVLRLTIAPSGEVTTCEIVSSELHDPKLERRLRRRVTLFDFGAKEVESVTITYPIEFLPA